MIQCFEGDGVSDADRIAHTLLTAAERTALAKLRDYPQHLQPLGGLAVWLGRLSRGNRRSLHMINCADTHIMSQILAETSMRDTIVDQVHVGLLYAARHAIARIKKAML